MKRYLRFDQVQIQPENVSAVDSRKDVILRNNDTYGPLIISNMDSTGTFEMARKVCPLGGMVALHKYYTAEQIIEFFKENGYLVPRVFVTIGLESGGLDKLKTIEGYVLKNYISNHINVCLDVANGYMSKFLRLIGQVSSEIEHGEILSGNICSSKILRDYQEAGATIVKVGIANGGACLTSPKTGVGVPQLTLIQECREEINKYGLNLSLCSDGGCKSPGDIAKAIVAGADYVMIGSMVAGTNECDGLRRDLHIGTSYDSNRYRYVDNYQKQFYFYGMSSKKAHEVHSEGLDDYKASEGSESWIDVKGPVTPIIQEIHGGLRSMASYLGQDSVEDCVGLNLFVEVG